MGMKSGAALQEREIDRERETETETEKGGGEERALRAKRAGFTARGKHH